MDENLRFPQKDCFVIRVPKHFYSLELLPIFPLFLRTSIKKKKKRKKKARKKGMQIWGQRIHLVYSVFVESPCLMKIQSAFLLKRSF